MCVCASCCRQNRKGPSNDRWCTSCAEDENDSDNNDGEDGDEDEDNNCSPKYGTAESDLHPTWFESEMVDDVRCPVSSNILSPRIGNGMLEGEGLICPTCLTVFPSIPSLLQHSLTCVVMKESDPKQKSADSESVRPNSTGGRSTRHSIFL